MPRWKGSDNYQSSDNFRDWIRKHRSHLIVPEREIVPLIDGWNSNAEVELKDYQPGRCHGELDATRTAKAFGEHCKHCGSGPEPGSYLYCPECHRSGFDFSLQQQLLIVGVPLAERARASAETVAKARKVAAQVAEKALRVAAKHGKPNGKSPLKGGIGR